MLLIGAGVTYKLLKTKHPKSENLKGFYPKFISRYASVVALQRAE